MIYLTQQLEKYFGPTAPYFGPGAEPPKPEQVQHVDISNAALGATIREYTIPDGPMAMAHSIVVDHQGDPWFTQHSYLRDKTAALVRFRVGPEKFDEYPVTMPHSDVVGKDGLVWASLVDRRQLGDLASVDPRTGKVSIYSIPPPSRKKGIHLVAVDSKGNIWGGGNSVWKFDVQTHKFQEYPIPLPTLPESSAEYWHQVPGQPLKTQDTDSNETFYDIKVDSKDKVWVTATVFGALIRLDPVTGETKTFQDPTISLLKGLNADAQDNIWFADYGGHKLGKLDPKTGTFKFYQTPASRGGPYGIMFDKKGNVWFADSFANSINRFDPKTEQFTVFPLPSNNAFARYCGMDDKGRIWFTESFLGKIGVLDPGEGGK